MLISFYSYQSSTAFYFIYVVSDCILFALMHSFPASRHMTAFSQSEQRSSRDQVLAVYSAYGLFDVVAAELELSSRSSLALARSPIKKEKKRKTSEGRSKMNTRKITSTEQRLQAKR